MQNKKKLPRQRLPPSKQQQQHMSILNRQSEEDMKPNFETEPHVVANMIKQFFREMQMPLCQIELLDDWHSIGMQCKENKPQPLKNIIRRMHEMNRNILMELVRFLKTFTELSHLNKMDETNIALMFAPNIFRNIRGNEQVSMSSLGLM